MFTSYPKLYLRTKNNTTLSTKDFPLAFMTPYEDNSNGVKRQKTVDDWANAAIWDKELRKYVYPEQPKAHIIDNVPLNGFKISNYKNRSSTDNKVFEIDDPRGFKLQIYADNLINLIQNHTIVNGVIQTPLIWARNGNNNILATPSECGEIQERKSSGISVGDKISVKNKIYHYYGKFVCVYIQTKQHKRNTDNDLKYHTSHMEFTPLVETKEVHVFHDGTGFVLYKSIPKHLFIENTKIGDFSFGKPYNAHKAGSGYTPFDKVLFYDKIDDALTYRIKDVEEAKEYLKNSWWSYYVGKIIFEGNEYSVDGLPRNRV